MSCVQEQKKKQKKKKKSKLRRKKDVMVGLPFLMAYMGDPARKFYCNDIRTYELIYDGDQRNRPMSRLLRYQDHHVTSIAIQGKVLIFKAGE